jgi:hypothetical protein
MLLVAPDDGSIGLQAQTAAPYATILRNVPTGPALFLRSVACLGGLLNGGVWTKHLTSTLGSPAQWQGNSSRQAAFNVKRLLGVVVVVGFVLEVSSGHVVCHEVFHTEITGSSCTVYVIAFSTIYVVLRRANVLLWSRLLHVVRKRTKSRWHMFLLDYKSHFRDWVTKMLRSPLHWLRSVGSTVALIAERDMWRMRADMLNISVYMPPSYQHRLLSGYSRRRKVSESTQLLA